MPDDKLSHVEALVFAERCRQAGVIVLGIDRFVRLPEGLLPDLGRIADFSGHLTMGDVASNAKMVISFLELHGSEPAECFEFAVADKA